VERRFTGPVLAIPSDACCFSWGCDLPGVVVVEAPGKTMRFVCCARHADEFLARGGLLVASTRSEDT
jgi:hypothetical protein